MPDRDWMNKAKCRNHPNPDIFFASEKGSNANPQIARQLAEAKAICKTCPVTAPCEQYRRNTDSAFGVWGGAVAPQTQRYGGTGRTRLMHGTEAMYKRHLRRRETPCHSCRVAQQRARALRWRDKGA
jgi:hypothetical protein